jgi:hypothetical protein
MIGSPYESTVFSISQFNSPRLMLANSVAIKSTTFEFFNLSSNMFFSVETMLESLMGWIEKLKLYLVLWISATEHLNTYKIDTISVFSGIIDI